MIFTVSTVKDTLANVQAYVERNLAGGADHLLVFLDGPDAEVQTFLDAHPHATGVLTDASYWTPDRPESLNARQVTNANLALAALAGFEWADWLFHIDADESLQIDPERMAREVPPERNVVRIAPLEAVSQMRWDGEVSHFKPMLPKEKIAELVEAGVIEAPDDDEPPNATWFRGHVQGKIGVRPDLDTRMQLHRAVWQGDETVQPAFGRPWLSHRHYESHDGEEFVRKWLAHLSAGQVRFRKRRGRLQEEIRAVVEDGSLDEAGQRAALTAIYRREIEDDLPRLLELGLLVEPEPGTHRPRDFPSGGREQLDRMLGLLRTADKRAFNPQLADPWPVDEFERIRADLGEDDPLAGVVDRAIGRALASAEARGAGRKRKPPGGGLTRLFRRR